MVFLNSKVIKKKKNMQKKKKNILKKEIVCVRFWFPLSFSLGLLGEELFGDSQCICCG